MCDDCEKEASFRDPKIPYVERIIDGFHVRKFGADTDPWDLVWHWDPEDRLVSADEPNGWQLQLDDQLPIDFPTTPFLIQKGVYHRVIKGHGPLTVRVRKLQ